MKQCHKCKKWKSESEFYKSSTGKNGLMERCKECHKTYSRRYFQVHRFDRYQYTKKYRQTIKGYLRERFYAMKQRCNNPNCKSYKYYGGRGIKVKFMSVNEFINYVINGLQIDPRGLDIDRIDNNGHYEKENIRFVSHAKNNNNKRRYYGC